MASKQHVLGLIDTSRQIRRPPLVGMEFLHERSVRAGDLGQARTGPNAKDLISLLFSHFAASRRARTEARVRISLHVLTPAGSPAVKITS